MAKEKSLRGFYKGKQNKTYYGELDKYNQATYKRLASIRKIAEPFGVSVHKLPSRNTYVATTPDGLTKVFDNLDAMEEFLKNYNTTRENFA